jgi:hypothetical protein
VNFRQLTTEELQPLAQDFTLFLSANGIDATYWQKLKDENNESVIHFIKQFSDSVWFKILSNKSFLDLKNETGVYTMNFLANACIIIKVSQSTDSDSVEISMMEKKYELSREEDMYQWMMQGAEFSDGNSYKEACLLWADSKQNQSL